MKKCSDFPMCCKRSMTFPVCCGQKITIKPAPGLKIGDEEWIQFTDSVQKLIGEDCMEGFYEDYRLRKSTND